MNTETAPRAVIEVHDARLDVQKDVFDALNQRWMMQTLFSLSETPTRSNDLVKATGINANTLRDRLRRLETLGVVVREVVSSMPPHVLYYLSPRGVGLLKALEPLTRWISGACLMIVGMGQIQDLFSIQFC